VVYLRQKSLLTEERIVLDVKKIADDGKEEPERQAVSRSSVSLHQIKFEKDKTYIIELYPEQWQADKQYGFALTFYLSHPRFELKQRDRHMLFRYVSPFE
jgi:hypothetical protein